MKSIPPNRNTYGPYDTILWPLLGLGTSPLHSVTLVVTFPSTTEATKRSLKCSCCRSTPPKITIKLSPWRSKWWRCFVVHIKKEIFLPHWPLPFRLASGSYPHYWGVHGLVRLTASQHSYLFSSFRFLHDMLVTSGGRKGRFNQGRFFARIYIVYCPIFGD